MKIIITESQLDKLYNDPIMGVIKDYVKKLPFNGKRDNFFMEFIKEFPDGETFNDRLWDYVDEPELGDELEDVWSPEDDVYMLEDNIGYYPGDEVWVDFYNDLINAGW